MNKVITVGLLAALAMTVAVAGLSTTSSTAYAQGRPDGCDGDPHSGPTKDGGNPHHPPVDDGNPHFCPPIGSG